jgi:hypothetical protein
MQIVRPRAEEAMTQAPLVRMGRDGFHTDAAAVDRPGELTCRRPLTQRVLPRRAGHCVAAVEGPPASRACRAIAWTILYFLSCRLSARLKRLPSRDATEGNMVSADFRHVGSSARNDSPTVGQTAIPRSASKSST